MGYFEVNKLPLKVTKNEGFNSKSGVKITRTRLLLNNSYNNVPTYTFNSGNAGLSFEVNVVIKPEYEYNGRTYAYWLDYWEKFQEPVSVITNAIDVPNGKYLLTIEDKKQTNEYYSIWKLKFEQYYEDNSTFGQLQKNYDPLFSSTDIALLDSESTINKNSNEYYIIALQDKLKQLGYLNPSASSDGVWNDELTRGIADFQKDQELTQTGLGDTETILRITSVDKPLPDLSNINVANIVIDGVIR